MLVLDTDVLIDIQRGHPSAVTWFSTLQDLPTVPGFVVMELIQDAKDKHQMRDTMRLVAPLPVAWPTTDDCQRALSDFATYHLSDGLGLLDAMIASCTRGLSATLCTFNHKHYRVVPGLTTLQPYSRQTTP